MKTELSILSLFNHCLAGLCYRPVAGRTKDLVRKICFGILYHNFGFKIQLCQLQVIYSLKLSSTDM